jgi:hypothetical protein
VALRSSGIELREPLLCRHCDSALHAGARRKGIVAVADAARSRLVETNRPVEAVLAAELKPDASRSRLLSHRSRASTDRPCTGMQVPRTDSTVLDQRLPLRLAKRSPRRRELGRCRNSSQASTPSGSTLASATTPAERQSSAPAQRPSSLVTWSQSPTPHTTAAPLHDDQHGPPFVCEQVRAHVRSRPITAVNSRAVQVPGVESKRL